MKKMIGLTVKQMKEKLTQLEKEGYGDYRVWVGYDTDMAYTTASERYEVREDGIWTGIYFEGG